MSKSKSRMRLAGIAAIATCTIDGAAADSVADLDKGKQITMVVGYGTWLAGFYVDARRPAARGIAALDPGQRDRGGAEHAGCRKPAPVNHLYNLVPEDGTVMADFSRNMPLLAVLETIRTRASTPQVHLARLVVELRERRLYPGGAHRRSGEDHRGCVLEGRHADRARRIVEGSTSNDVPVILRDTMVETTSRVAGYPDSAAPFLATDVVRCTAAWSISGVKTIKPHWLKPDSGPEGAGAVRRGYRVAEVR